MFERTTYQQSVSSEDWAGSLIETRHIPSARQNRSAVVQHSRITWRCSTTCNAARNYVHYNAQRPRLILWGCFVLIALKNVPFLKKIVFLNIFKNIFLSKLIAWYNHGSGSKLCQYPGYGSKLNEFGSTKLVPHVQHFLMSTWRYLLQ